VVRKLKVFLAVGALLCVMGTLIMPQGAAAASRVFLNIGTTNKTSVAYIYYASMVKLFNERAPELKPTIIETGASMDNIERIVQGQLDLGLSSTDVAYQAYHGLGHWKERPVPDLRYLMVYSENTVLYVVPVETGIRDPMELTGKRVFPGMRGSANEAMCEAIFEVLGIKPEWYRGTLADATAAMKDRRIVCMNKTSNGTIPDSAFLEIQTFILPLRPLEWKEEQVAKVKEVYPYFLTMIQPTGYLNGQEKDTLSWANALGDVALASLPEDVAYKYVKTCYEGKDILGTGYSAAAETDSVKATLKVGIPLHAGTVRYFREIGVDVPDSLIPPEMK